MPASVFFSSLALVLGHLMFSQLLNLGDAFVLVPLQLPNLGAQHLLFVHVMEQVVKLSSQEMNCVSGCS